MGSHPMPEFRLSPGMANIARNARRLIKEGWDKETAWEYAYRFARTQSSRVFDQIHRTGRNEQRLR